MNSLQTPSLRFGVCGEMINWNLFELWLDHDSVTLVIRSATAPEADFVMGYRGNVIDVTIRENCSAI